MSHESNDTRNVEPVVTPLVTKEAYRNGMAKLGTAVSIVTTDGPAGKAGFTASAICSVTDTPPTLLVCLNRAASVYDAVSKNGVVAVNTLAPQHQGLASLFGGKTPVDELAFLKSVTEDDKNAPSPRRAGGAQFQPDDPQNATPVAPIDENAPVEKTLKSFAVNLNGNPAFGQILNQARGEKVESKLVGIDKADIIETEIKNRTAYVTVKFVSELISVTRDAEDEVVEGDAKKVREVTDIWTFARDLASKNPNWKLVATEAAN